MKKKIISMILVLLLALGMTLPVMADPMPYILDESDVLTDEEEADAVFYAELIATVYGIQPVYICTDITNGLDNETYASQISSVYSEDCIIFIDNQESGTIYIEGFGRAIDILSPENCDTLLNAYNDNATFSGGLQVYLATLDQMLASYTPEEQAEVEENSEEAPEEESAEAEVETSHIPEERLLPRLNDEADILTDEEEAELLSLLDEISERQQFDVVIATVNDFEQADVKNAAYDYYDYNGFGFGEENDGVWLYLSMGERDLNIGGTGFGITAFTDFGREQILEQIKPELGEDQYHAAFVEFVQIADDYITEAKSGTPYDVDHAAFEAELGLDSIIFLFCCFMLVGMLISLIIVKREERKLKSVHSATNAKDYLRKGSLHITKEKEYFLNTETISVYRPEEKGGSTVDSGSSGVEHSSTSSKF